MEKIYTIQLTEKDVHAIITALCLQSYDKKNKAHEEMLQDVAMKVDEQYITQKREG